MRNSEGGQKLAAMRHLSLQEQVTCGRWGASNYFPATEDRPKEVPRVEQRLQKLMQELGEAINESLSDSEQIAEVISKIKSGGYDVFLVLEATIGFNRTDEADEEIEAEKSHDPELKVNAQDMKFLKSLRITLEGEDRLQ